MSKRALITGSSRGIGLALTKEFVRHGWEVVATAREPQGAELSELIESSNNVTALKLDVCDESSVRQAATKLGDKALDILVNNAALFPGEGHETLQSLKPEWFNQAFDANVVGVVRVVQAFLPQLKKSGHAQVANISSGAGSISEKEDFDYYPYSVSKAALNMLTRALAAELRSHGIGVTAISPGWVRTRMGGENAPLTPEESAKSLFQTITSLTIAQSGKFLGRDGESYAW